MQDCKMINRVLLVRMNSLIRMKTPHPYIPMLPFALKYTEALLKKNTQREVMLLDCKAEPGLMKEVVKTSIKFNPDLLIFDSSIADTSLTLETAASIKKQKSRTVIVCIGSGISSSADSYLYPDSPVDIGVLGEPELEVLNLIKRLTDSSDIKNIREYYLKKGINLIENLDRLPFPNIDFADFKRYYLLYPLRMNKKVRCGYILTSRGCPHGCIFCSPALRTSYGGRLRRRSPRNVADEIEYLTMQGANLICMDDDDFTASREHVYSICEEMIRRNLNIPWIAHARIDELDSAMLTTMKKANCSLLRFGVESASRRILGIINKSSCPDWAERAAQSFKKCRQIGISTVGLFLIGNPTETEDEILETLNLSKKIRPDIIQVAYFTPYPGSKAGLKFEDRLDNTNPSNLYHYAMPCEKTNLSKVKTPKLVEIYKLFYRNFLLDIRFIILHFKKYTLFYIHNPRILFRLLGIFRYYIKRR